MWCNEPDTVGRCRIFMSDITDYLPVFVVLKLSSDVHADAYPSLQRQIIIAQNKNVFKEIVYRLDWNTVITNHDPESPFNVFFMIN